MLQIEKMQRIDLGYQGENEARTILIDCSAWAQMYENGEFTILHRRPGEENADVVDGAEYNGETMTLSWTPTEYDTSYAGKGQAQIVLMEDGIMKATQILGTEIRESLSLPD